MSKRKRDNNNRLKREKRRIQSENDEILLPPPPISKTLIIVILVIQILIQNFNFFTGKREKHRKRKDLEEDVFNPLGDYFICRAYRMSRNSFYVLHDILQPYLLEHFFPSGGGTRDPKTDPYLIKTEMRLAIALCYFAGGSPLDIMLIHGVSFTSVFTSVWGVVDCVNKCKELELKFPSKEEQLEISYGYKQKSGALFDCVIGAIDGILIWILKPTRNECDIAGCQEASFKCSRKDKFGLNMQAICDHKFRIRWIDLTWPGNSSDYMAWVTSDFYHDLNTNPWQHILPGMTILGDSAYIKSPFMSVPFKNFVTADKDAYNFYQSQLRITVEQTFGILVHRWAMLRGPLNVPLMAVPSLVMTLCRLHNFCIDIQDVINKDNRKDYKTDENDEIYLQHLVAISNSLKDIDMDTSDVVVVGDIGPAGLLDRGDHFNDCPHNRPKIVAENYPMDTMLKPVENQGLLRPAVNFN